MDKFLINLTDKVLTPDQVSVLSKGLNFCPTPREPIPGDLRSDLDRLHRKLRLHSYFLEEDDCPLTPLLEGNFHSLTEFVHPKFKLASKFNPTGPPVLESMITLNEHDFNNRDVFFSTGHNLTKGERAALRQLQSMEDVIIKSADKGGMIVLQTRDQYLSEGIRQLSDNQFYKKLDHNLTEQHTKEINDFLLTMLNKSEIDITVYNYLFNKDCRTPIFYLLPKIHKGLKPLKGRPIVSAVNSHTEKISQFVDHFLNPCSTKGRSYIKDTTHFLTILEELGPLPENSWLLTLDVSSLYTVIPNVEGLHAARESLHEFRPNPNVKPSNDSLVKLLELVLTKNNFQFNGEHYLQISGTSMGSKTAPSFAVTFMNNFEEDFVYTYPHQPLIWKRYIDDCFCIFVGTEAQVKQFITYLNSCNQNIKFTHDISQKQITFLDTTVLLQPDNTLKTDLHCKPTDSHNYLLYTSSHPKKCIERIPYSQLLRIRRICSDISDFDKHMKTMCLHFLKRGYPLDLLRTSALKARRTDRHSLLHTTKTNPTDNDRSVLITTFHPHDNTVRGIVQKNWDILGKSHSTLPIYERKPMVAYRRPKNIKDLLVHADCKLKKPESQHTRNETKTFLYNSNTQQTTDTKQSVITQFFKANTTNHICASSSLSDIPTLNRTGPRQSNSSSKINAQSTHRRTCTNKKCQFCPLLNKKNTFQCSTTGITYPCKYNISCKSSNLIYCITCKTCNKQYVGQTRNTVAQRFSGHFFNVRHNKKTDAVGLHFSRSDHNGTSDFSINILEFIPLPPHTDRSLDLRLRLEKNWIHTLRCPAPRGLNIFD